MLDDTETSSTTDADESLKAPRAGSVDTTPPTEQIKAKLIKFKSEGKPASSSFNPSTQGH
ncbi:MAG: hypothetical protein EBY22_09235 [Gammaproteobacteria bacterium]|jgi:hypothetical protein|nr:hypothetical protein [Gammaproteobacteria bacterium]